MSAKDFFRSIEKNIRRIEDALVIFCGFIFMVMMFLGTADVLGRYAIDKPIMGTQELNSVMMGAIVLLGWAYTRKEEGHVNVTLFYNMFPVRIQSVLTLITLTLSLVLFVVIAEESLVIAITKLMEGRRSVITEMPTGPFYFLVPAGAFFMCLELLLRIVKQIPVLKKR
jgi:TRAP-type C4-dicarboxylate transport system permease small subunit